MIKLKIISGDPGRSNDPFGIVGLEATYPEKRIHITYAKQFIRANYSAVANHISLLKKSINPDMILIEKNFDYDKLKVIFSKLPITFVTTSAGLTDKVREDGWAVDKPFMIKWLKDQYKIHTVQYPMRTSKDMGELINQQNQIVGVTAASGHVSYKAQRNRHDDLFMAKLIGCNAIRIWWNQQ